MSPSKSRKKFLRKEDFDQVHVSGYFENLTSKVTLMSEDSVVPVLVLELEEKSLVIHLAASVGNVGHHIAMKLCLRHGGRELRLDCTGKIAELEMLLNGCRVHVKLLQFPLHDWEAFQKYFDELFDKVAEHFSRMKG